MLKILIMTVSYFLRKLPAQKLKEIAGFENPEMTISIKEHDDGMVLFTVITEHPRWLFWLGRAYARYCEEK